jgi:hypothetical protein
VHLIRAAAMFDHGFAVVMAAAGAALCTAACCQPAKY